MLMYGKNIQQSSDLLAKITVEQLINIIKGNNQSIVQQIEELRHLQSIDLMAYKKLKTLLPYFTISVFNPPVRKTENFAYSEYLVVDIDHVSKVSFTPQQIKEKVKSDNRIMSAFVSPGNNGIKLLFKLAPRITDPGLYKNFYKLFAIKFAQTYNLEEIIDLKTCDVTRANFISYDPDIYVNLQANAINYNEYININNTLELKLAQKEIKEFEKSRQNEQPVSKTILTDDILLQIKQKLNPNYKPPKAEPFVPEKLNSIIPIIVDQLQKEGLIVENIENIHYGKKLKIKLQTRWAEINIFYGKKGFSVVRTPKNGSNEELGTIVLEYIQQLLSTIPH